MRRWFMILVLALLVYYQFVFSSDVMKYTAELDEAVQYESWWSANDAIQKLNSMGKAAEGCQPQVEKALNAAIAYRKTHPKNDEKNKIATIVLWRAAEILERFNQQSKMAQPLMGLFRHELEMLKNGRKGSGVNYYVLNALARCGAYVSSVVPDIIPVIREKSWYNYNGIYEILGSIGPLAASALPDLLITIEKNSPPLEIDDKISIYSALARIDTSSTDIYIGRIVDFLGTEEWKSAIIALEELGPLARSFTPMILEKVVANSNVTDNSIISLSCKLGGGAFAQAIDLVGDSLSIYSILAIGKMDGAAESKVALPALVKALDSNIKVKYAGMRASVGAPQYTLSASAAAVWAIRKNNLQNDAFVLLKQNPDLMLRTYKEIISLGVEGSIPDLLNILNAYGNKKMASEFLNSGHPQLVRAANLWAKTQGYSIVRSNFQTNYPGWGVYDQ